MKLVKLFLVFFTLFAVSLCVADVFVAIGDPGQDNEWVKNKFSKASNENYYKLDGKTGTAVSGNTNFKNVMEAIKKLGSAPDHYIILGDLAYTENKFLGTIDAAKTNGKDTKMNVVTGSFWSDRFKNLAEHVVSLIGSKEIYITPGNHQFDINPILANTVLSSLNTGAGGVYYGGGKPLSAKPTTADYLLRNPRVITKTHVIFIDLNMALIKTAYDNTVANFFVDKDNSILAANAYKKEFDAIMADSAIKASTLWKVVRGHETPFNIEGDEPSLAGEFMTKIMALGVRIFIGSHYHAAAVMLKDTKSTTAVPYNTLLANDPYCVFTPTIAKQEVKSCAPAKRSDPFKTVTIDINLNFKSTGTFFLQFVIGHSGRYLDPLLISKPENYTKSTILWARAETSAGFTGAEKTTDAVFGAANFSFNSPTDLTVTYISPVVAGGKVTAANKDAIINVKHSDSANTATAAIAARRKLK